MRNLLKNLISKYSIDEVRNAVPKEYEALVNHVNKYKVRKIKAMSKEDEAVYGSTKLDNSVMMDNDENLLDEEEEYIEKEFKKVENKKKEEESLLENIKKLKMEEDDPELVNKFNNQQKPQNNEKMDKIEQLFNKDKVTYF